MYPEINIKPLPIDEEDKQFKHNLQFADIWTMYTIRASWKENSQIVSIYINY